MFDPLIACFRNRMTFKKLMGNRQISRVPYHVPGESAIPAKSEHFPTIFGITTLRIPPDRGRDTDSATHDLRMSRTGASLS
jgi:hypothetical protein